MNDIKIRKINSDLGFLLSSVGNYWRDHNLLRANDEELTRLWDLYAELRNQLIILDKDFFGNLRIFNLPKPDNSNSFYSEYGGLFDRERDLQPLYNEMGLLSSYFTSYMNSIIKKTLSHEPIYYLKLISKNFHDVARQLQERYNNRPTISIDDEHDVQYLFHALLKLFFEDIRPEEWTPSYAGNSNRMDFLLKNEKFVVEIKKTRKGLDSKILGEQLIIDIAKYQNHLDCNMLFCFIYDPEGRISNPKGLEKDLTKKHNEIEVVVSIHPK